jgi:hypothetical protein
MMSATAHGMCPTEVGSPKNSCGAAVPLDETRQHNGIKDEIRLLVCADPARWSVAAPIDFVYHVAQLAA